MWQQGQRLTAALVAFCAVIAPAGYILFMLVLLLAARRRRCRTGPPRCCAGWVIFKIWSMLEVVMLGVLVALTKIAQLASVNPGIGMYAFGATSY